MINKTEKKTLIDSGYYFSTGKIKGLNFKRARGIWKRFGKNSEYYIGRSWVDAVNHFSKMNQRK